MVKKQKKDFTCKIGDKVMFDDKVVVANEILSSGREPYISKKGLKIAGVKDCISVLMIDNGQVLTRSPKYVGCNWQHI